MAKEGNQSTGASNHQEHRVKGSELFVGGLARTVTESKIREIFAPYGEIVELRMMRDQNGATKGFCFVRFATKEAALKAHKEKNGIMLEGKKVGVTLSSDRDKLFFGNLPKDWSPEEFDKLVRQAFEDVVNVDLALAPSSDASLVDKRKLNRGFAFVQFSSHGAAARAHRSGSRADFVLPGGWHPFVDWAEKEPDLDSEEMAKVKVAFVGNLPASADEDFLRKLFEPFGQIDRVALSRKSQFPVGFVHFANRSELENAIKEMDGKTIQGPHGDPPFKIQVALAKLGEKDKKRTRDDTIKPGSRSSSLSSAVTQDVMGHKSKAPRFASSEMVSDVADPYEKAIIELPAAIKERLLRIFRLGIATRYDVEARHIATLKELPESTAIAVLDQFMISGAEKHDKGAYLASLLARQQQVEKLGTGWMSSCIPRTRTDYVVGESKLVSFKAPVPQAIDSSAPRLGSDRGTVELPPYSFPMLEDSFRTQPATRKLEDPISSYRDPVSLSSLGKLEAASRSNLGRFEDRESLYRDQVSLSSLESSYRDPVSQSRLGRLEDTISSYRETVPSSYLGYSSSIRPLPRSSLSERPAPERPQIKFDPFTGQPYKFDPFTGEPIRPEARPHHSSSPF